MPLMLEQDKIKKAIIKSVPLTVTTYTMPHETEENLEILLGQFLLEMGQKDLQSNLAYCLRELAVNAKKANTKRVYFEERNLSLNKAEDYEKGMKSFKEDTLTNLKHYLQLQKKSKLYIKIIFHVKSNVFHITIKNNCQLTKKEHMRIYDRIARSRAYQSMDEAFAEILDDSEGAGLGIVIMILMLKKMGLGENAFDIEGVGGETIARLRIPLSQIKKESMNLLTDKLTNEIESLPHFPENIVQLQKMLQDPDVYVPDITKWISQDVALTADLLKEVNSAQFMLPTRVDKIGQAVNLLGLKRLKTIIYKYGTQKILKKNSQEQRIMWDHSYKVAIFAYMLAKSKGMKGDSLDDTYVGGILHDIGKIIFFNIENTLLDKMKDFSYSKNISPQVLESIAAGINHAEIGGQIAKAWNFPDILSESIQFHHDPLACNVKYRPVVFNVYMANVLAQDDELELFYEHLDLEVLSYFRIDSIEKLLEVKNRLEKQYKLEISKMNQE